MKKSEKLGDIMTTIGLGCIFIWFVIFLIDIFKLHLYYHSLWYIGMGLTFIAMILYYWFSSKSNSLEIILGNSIIIGFGLFTLSVLYTLIKFIIYRPLWLILLVLGGVICSLANHYIFSDPLIYKDDNLTEDDIKALEEFENQE